MRDDNVLEIVRNGEQLTFQQWADLFLENYSKPPLRTPKTLERLAFLTPRPRVNLILYYGVLAPRAAWRSALVSGTSHGVDMSHVEPSVEGDDPRPSRAGAYQWAELMRRTGGLDVLACPRCGAGCALWR